MNGYPLGTRPATDDEIARYLAAVDRASPRVRTGLLARSWQGRPLPYALVSRPGSLAPRPLARVARTMRELRAGRLGARAAARAARRLPAFAWIAANVHGNEPSGSDAAMKLLYELAARTDCANLTRLDRLVTVLVPLQNPDGRANGQRVNAYGFDLNRDWFAATQPETAGKLALLRRLPPILYVDAHEEPGVGGFFFPPNADPIHHEISGQALGAIDGVFGPALRRAFDARGLAYTNYATFDLFFMGYGDTVPTTAFGAAGMTFEKGAQAPFAERMVQHFLAQDTALSTAARQKDRLLTAWAAQWRQARSEGRRGELEPNVVVQPGNRVRFPVPGKRIYAYALAAGENAADAGRLVDRLRSVGVEVSALARARRIERFHAYGEEGSRAVALPAGTYWISMAQAQKHWVEAMLGEDAYVPFPYFYDVSAWSNPLLMGLHGGAVEAPADPGRLRAVDPGARGTAPDRPAAAYAFSTDSTGALALAVDLLRRGIPVSRAPAPLEPAGRRLPAGAAVVPGSADLDVLRSAARARATPVVALGADPAGLVPLSLPRVALYDDPASETARTQAAASEGWARYVLERRLGLPVDVVTGSDLEAGALAAHQVLVIPDGAVGGPGPGADLTPAALAQIQAFVRAGGTLVGYRRAGLTVAEAAGLTAASEATPPSGFQIPGASLRIELDAGDPLAWGFDGETFVFDNADPILQPGGARVVGSYPTGERFFASGYTEGAGALRGTPAVLDQPAGAGRALLMSFDPNFRAYTEAGERLFANAVLYPAPPAAAARRADAPRPLRPAALARDPGPGRATIVRVRAGDSATLRAALRASGAPRDARVTGATLRAPNPLGLDADERPWIGRLLARLRTAGVRPRLVVL